MELRKCKQCNNDFYSHLGWVYCCEPCRKKALNKASYKRHKEKMKNKVYALSFNTRQIIYRSIKKKKLFKKYPFPFTEEEFFKCINEQLLLPYNKEFNYNNFGKKWSINHLIPISWATTEEEIFKICWNLNNLEVLSIEKNQSQNSHYALIQEKEYYNKEKAFKKFRELYNVNTETSLINVNKS